MAFAVHLATDGEHSSNRRAFSLHRAAALLRRAVLTMTDLDGASEPVRQAAVQMLRYVGTSRGLRAARFAPWDCGEQKSAAPAIVAHEDPDTRVATAIVFDFRAGLAYSIELGAGALRQGFRKIACYKLARANADAANDLLDTLADYESYAADSGVAHAVVPRDAALEERSTAGRDHRERRVRECGFAEDADESATIKKLVRAAVPTAGNVGFHTLIVALRVAMHALGRRFPESAAFDADRVLDGVLHRCREMIEASAARAIVAGGDLASRRASEIGNLLRYGSALPMGERIRSAILGAPSGARSDAPPAPAPLCATTAQCADPASWESPWRARRSSTLGARTAPLGALDAMALAAAPATAAELAGYISKMAPFVALACSQRSLDANRIVPAIGARAALAVSFGVAARALDEILRGAGGRQRQQSHQQSQSQQPIDAVGSEESGDRRGSDAMERATAARTRMSLRASTVRKSEISEAEVAERKEEARSRAQRLRALREARAESGLSDSSSGNSDSEEDEEEEEEEDEEQAEPISWPSDEDAEVIFSAVCSVATAALSEVSEASSAGISSSSRSYAGSKPVESAVGRDTVGFFLLHVAASLARHPAVSASFYGADAAESDKAGIGRIDERAFSACLPRWLEFSCGGDVRMREAFDVAGTKTRRDALSAVVGVPIPGAGDDYAWRACYAVAAASRRLPKYSSDPSGLRCSNYGADTESGRLGPAAREFLRACALSNCAIASDVQAVHPDTIASFCDRSQPRVLADSRSPVVGSAPSLDRRGARRRGGGPADRPLGRLAALWVAVAPSDASASSSSQPKAIKTMSASIVDAETARAKKPKHSDYAPLLEALEASARDRTYFDRTVELARVKRAESTSARFPERAFETVEFPEKRTEHLRIPLPSLFYEKAIDQRTGNAMDLVAVYGQRQTRQGGYGTQVMLSYDPAVDGRTLRIARSSDDLLFLARRMAQCWKAGAAEFESREWKESMTCAAAVGAPWMRSEWFGGAGAPDFLDASVGLQAHAAAASAAAERISRACRGGCPVVLEATTQAVVSGRPAAEALAAAAAFISESSEYATASDATVRLMEAKRAFFSAESKDALYAAATAAFVLGDDPLFGVAVPIACTGAPFGHASDERSQQQQQQQHQQQQQRKRSKSLKRAQGGGGEEEDKEAGATATASVTLRCASLMSDESDYIWIPRAGGSGDAASTAATARVFANKLPLIPRDELAQTTGDGSAAEGAGGSDLDPVAELAAPSELFSAAAAWKGKDAAALYAAAIYPLWKTAYEGREFKVVPCETWRLSRPKRTVDSSAADLRGRLLDGAEWVTVSAYGPTLEQRLTCIFYGDGRAAVAVASHESGVAAPVYFDAITTNPASRGSDVFGAWSARCYGRALLLRERVDRPSSSTAAAAQARHALAYFIGPTMKNTPESAASEESMSAWSWNACGAVAAAAMTSADCALVSDDHGVRAAAAAEIERAIEADAREARGEEDSDAASSDSSAASGRKKYKTRFAIGRDKRAVEARISAAYSSPFKVRAASVDSAPDALVVAWIHPGGLWLEQSLLVAPQATNRYPALAEPAFGNSACLSPFVSGFYAQLACAPSSGSDALCPCSDPDSIEACRSAQMSVVAAAFSSKAKRADGAITAVCKATEIVSAAISKASERAVTGGGGSASFCAAKSPLPKSPRRGKDAARRLQQQQPPPQAVVASFDGCFSMEASQVTKLANDLAIESGRVRSAQETPLSESIARAALWLQCGGLRKVVADRSRADDGRQNRPTKATQSGTECRCCCPAAAIAVDERVSAWVQERAAAEVLARTARELVDIAASAAPASESGARVYGSAVLEAAAQAVQNGSDGVADLSEPVDLALLLTELASGYFCRADQMELARNFGVAARDAPGDNGRAEQLLMGRGKTSFLTPWFAAHAMTRRAISAAAASAEAPAAFVELPCDRVTVLVPGNLVRQGVSELRKMAALLPHTPAVDAVRLNELGEKLDYVDPSRDASADTIGSRRSRSSRSSSSQLVGDPAPRLDRDGSDVESDEDFEEKSDDDDDDKCDEGRCGKKRRLKRKNRRDRREKDGPGSPDGAKDEELADLDRKRASKKAYKQTFYDALRGAYGDADAVRLIVVSDKVAQLAWLRACEHGVDTCGASEQTSSGRFPRFKSFWRGRSLIVDEVDSVVDPLSCESNIKSGDPKPIPYLRAAMRFIDRALGDVSDFPGEELPAAAAAAASSSSSSSSPSLGRSSSPSRSPPRKNKTTEEAGRGESGEDMPKWLRERYGEHVASANLLKYRQSYGFDDGVDARDKGCGLGIAIPYHRANEPIRGSEFTNIEFRMVLTRYAYRRRFRCAAEMLLDAGEPEAVAAAHAMPDADVVAFSALFAPVVGSKKRLLSPEERAEKMERIRERLPRSPELTSDDFVGAVFDAARTQEWPEMNALRVAVVRLAKKEEDARAIDPASSSVAAADSAPATYAVAGSAYYAFARALAIYAIETRVVMTEEQFSVGMLELLRDDDDDYDYDGSESVPGKISARRTRYMFSGTVDSLHVPKAIPAMKHALEKSLSASQAALESVGVSKARAEALFAGPITGVCVDDVQQRRIREALGSSSTLGGPKPGCPDWASRRDGGGGGDGGGSSGGSEHLPDPRAAPAVVSLIRLGSDESLLVPEVIAAATRPERGMNRGRPYDALIDVAGVFKLRSARYFAEKIYEGLECARDVYFVVDGVRSIMHRGARDGASAAVTAYSGVAPRDDLCFFFYDERNAVGIDFKQRKRMKALVVVDMHATASKVAQGAFRLRKLGSGHSFDYAWVKRFDDDAKKLAVEPTAAMMVDQFDYNEMASKATGASKSLLQHALAALRDAFASSDPSSYVVDVVNDSSLAAAAAAALALGAPPSAVSLRAGLVLSTKLSARIAARSCSSSSSSSSIVGSARLEAEAFARAISIVANPSEADLRALMREFGADLRAADSGRELHHQRAEDRAKESEHSADRENSMQMTYDPRALSASVPSPLTLCRFASADVHDAHIESFSHVAVRCRSDPLSGPSCGLLSAGSISVSDSVDPLTVDQRVVKLDALAARLDRATSLALGGFSAQSSKAPIVVSASYGATWELRGQRASDPLELQPPTCPYAIAFYRATSRQTAAWLSAETPIASSPSMQPKDGLTSAVRVARPDPNRQGGSAAAAASAALIRPKATVVLATVDDALYVHHCRMRNRRCVAEEDRLARKEEADQAKLRRSAAVSRKDKAHDALERTKRAADEKRRALGAAAWSMRAALSTLLERVLPREAQFAAGGGDSRLVRALRTKISRVAKAASALRIAREADAAADGPIDSDALDALERDANAVTKEVIDAGSNKAMFGPHQRAIETAVRAVVTARAALDKAADEASRASSSLEEATRKAGGADLDSVLRSLEVPRGRSRSEDDALPDASAAAAAATAAALARARIRLVRERTFEDRPPIRHFGDLLLLPNTLELDASLVPSLIDCGDLGQQQQQQQQRDRTSDLFSASKYAPDRGRLVLGMPKAFAWLYMNAPLSADDVAADIALPERTAFRDGCKGSALDDLGNVGLVEYLVAHRFASGKDAKSLAIAYRDAESKAREAEEAALSKETRALRESFGKLSAFAACVSERAAAIAGVAYPDRNSVLVTVRDVQMRLVDIAGGRKAAIGAVAKEYDCHEALASLWQTDIDSGVRLKSVLGAAAKALAAKVAEAERKKREREVGERKSAAVARRMRQKTPVSTASQPPLGYL
jgi:hypothetical protein